MASWLSSKPQETPLKVLVVSDDDQALSLICGPLSHAGHTVYLAPSAALAIPARDDEQPLPDRRRAIVAGAQLAPLDFVAGLFEAADPQIKGLACEFLDRLSIIVDRTPSDEFLDVFHADYVRLREFGPPDHDPCQIARNGGIMDEPRFILRTLCADYREISPEPNYNWCCGGGGGLVALGEETFDFRMKSSRIKADQIAEFGKCAPDDGGILVTACENCHTQLGNINTHYKLGLDVQFLSSMVADALVE